MIFSLSSPDNTTFPLFHAFSTFSLILLIMAAPMKLTDSNVESYYRTTGRLLTTRYHSYIIR